MYVEKPFKKHLMKSKNWLLTSSAQNKFIFFKSQSYLYVFTCFVFHILYNLYILYILYASSNINWFSTAIMSHYALILVWYKVT